MSSINELLESLPKTPFDDYDLKIPTNSTGNVLRERLLAILGVENEIRSKATRAKLLYRRALNRLERVKALAWDKLGVESPGIKATQGRIKVNTVQVVIDGETTTIHDEEERVNMYEYISERGRDKLEEVKDMLDVGRSALSWDKNELSNINT